MAKTVFSGLGAELHAARKISGLGIKEQLPFWWLTMNKVDPDPLNKRSRTRNSSVERVVVFHMIKPFVKINKNARGTNKKAGYSKG